MLPPVALIFLVFAAQALPQSGAKPAPADPSTPLIEPRRDYITVTATPGVAEDSRESPYVLFPISRKEWESRPAPTLGHALEGEPSILVQQTTPGQVSPFLRGLTGYQVLNLIDGVRFNNATFRSGPNQYLALVEPSQAQRVEAMLGPSGAQYGSDGLGGTIQVLTRSPQFPAGGAHTTHGEFALSGDSADLAGGATGEISFGSARLWALLGGAGYRHNNLLAGNGLDSHNAFTRFFGLPGSQVQELLGSRLQQTAWSRAGVHSKLAARLTDRQNLSFWYQRGVLSGVRGYKDLWGGLGRLQSDFNPQSLDFFYTRWEALRLRGFDTLSARLSFNRQVDGGGRRNLNYTDPLTEEENRVTALGYAAQATTHFGSHSILSLGGEYYDESVYSARTRNAVAQRPLYPDGASYGTLGLSAQGATEFAGRRLRAGYGLRFTRIGYRNPAAPQFGTPESSQRFTDWTWNASLLWSPSRYWGLHAAAGRGFRAPNLNDLGAIGLNDLGYEIPVAEALSSNPLLSNSDGEAALSKGVPARTLSVETLRNVEAGVRLNLSRVEARVQFFDSMLEDPIVRRTLLFSQSAVPASLAGLPVTPITPTAAQAVQGVVSVATAFDPRAVKAFVNDGRALYRGIESTANWRITDRWSLRGAYSFLIGRELDPDRNVRRLPPQAGSAAFRYTAGGRWWIEGALLAAGPQERLSGGDRDDERIGASRSRNDIAAFFNGSRVDGYLDSSRRFIPTGETLAQIQDRVLPGVTSPTLRVPLYTRTPGWVTLEVRGGFALTEQLSLVGALTNLSDRNYRVHGSGIDGPGRAAYAMLRWIF